MGKSVNIFVILFLLLFVLMVFSIVFDGHIKTFSEVLTFFSNLDSSVIGLKPLSVYLNIDNFGLDFSNLPSWLDFILTSAFSGINFIINVVSYVGSTLICVIAYIFQILKFVLS